MLHCDVIRDLMPLYVDGLASSESAALVEEHLSSCPACKALWEQMNAPEPESNQSGADFAHALGLQRRKQRRRVLLSCLGAVLLAAVLFCVYMECNYYDRTMVVTTTDQAKLTAECPLAELSREERDLAGEVFSWDVVQAHLGSETGVTLTEEEAAYFAYVVPEGAQSCRVEVLGSGVYIDYQYNGWRVILSYIDADGTGVTDVCSKSVTLAEEADVIYVVTYHTGAFMPTYQKYVTKHVWFSWVKVLMGELQLVE